MSIDAVCVWRFVGEQNVLMHSYSSYEKDALTLFGISLGIPWIQARIRRFKSPKLAGHATYTLLLTYSTGGTVDLHLSESWLTGSAWSFL